jgi:hypothetical protein
MAPYSATKGYYGAYRPPAQQGGYSAFANCTRCDNWSWASRLHDCGGKCSCGGWFGETRSKAASKGGGGNGFGGGGKAGKAYWGGGGSKGAWTSEASEDEKMASFLGKLAGSAVVASPELQAAVQLLIAVIPQKEESSKPKWREVGQAHAAAQKEAQKKRMAVHTRRDLIKGLEERIEGEKLKLVQEKKELEEAEVKEVEAGKAVQDFSTAQAARLAASEDETEPSEASASMDQDEAVAIEASRVESEASQARYEAALQGAAARKNKKAEAAARVQTRSAEQAATGAVKRIRADGGNVSMEAEQETQECAAPAQG